MNDASRQKLLAFNRELAALSATGLPLDLGMEGSEESLPGRLEEFSSLVSLRVGRGQSLEQAIADEPKLPPQYRAALSTWLSCDDSSVALDQVTRPAMARQQLGFSVGQSMVYPLVVLTLTYFAFLYLCSITAPKIEAMYAQLSQSPSSSLAVLVAGRNLIPIWGPLLPLLLVLTLVWWRWNSKRVSWTWMPFGSRYLDAMRNADDAQQLARLTESGLSIQESLILVRPFAGEANVASSPKDATVRSLPSLLRWAVSSDLGGEPAPRILRFVADTYRQNARRQATIWRVVTPAICGVLLGGTFVFGYALSLFLPVVQLLKDVSLPGGV